MNTIDPVAAFIADASSAFGRMDRQLEKLESVRETPAWRTLLDAIASRLFGSTRQSKTYFVCPSCAKLLNAPVECVGRQSRCRCGLKIVVPS